MTEAEQLHDRVLGGLAGAVIGDSMGTATETMTRRKIVERYGRLTEMVAPDFSPFSGGQLAGAYSDDSSQMLALVDRIVARGGVELDDVVQMLLDWAANEEMFTRTAGPTTRAAVARLRAGESPADVGRGDVHTGSGLSNGAAMKAAPAGWINPGNIQGAVADAATISLPSHNTQIAIAGAGAVAAAIATAIAPGATLAAVFDAALAGAREGERIGLQTGREAASASVERRIREAIRIGEEAATVWDVLDDLYDVIGTGLPTNESVPAAFGILAAARGDVTESIVGAINVGNDTDTVATIAGAIAGSLHGLSAVREDWYRRVCEVNELDLEATAAQLVQVGVRGAQPGLAPLTSAS